jgi:outer membrane protein OmpA-like peptidoglycan-associated protein
MLCTICNKNYANITVLKTHYTSDKHQFNLRNASKSNVPNINTVETRNLEQLPSVANNINTNTHASGLTQPGQNPAENNTQQPTVAENRTNLETTEISKYECPGCGKEYTQQNNMYRHRKNCYFYTEAYKISCKTQLDIKLAAKLLKQQNISRIFKTRY